MDVEDWHFFCISKRSKGGSRIMRPKTLDQTKTGSMAQSLEANLRTRVVGQEEAINQIANVYQAHLAGMTPVGRPIANFLFLGPTGSGKTRVVEATAECLLNDPRAIIKIDCAEFQHSHEIAKLIGSPPGYLGHRETQAALSQEELDRHHTGKAKISLVLFDEIEKASDSLWNLLLGILDKGTLTLGDNRKVDFSRCMIFMTSNLGAAEMTEVLRPRLGFAPSGRSRQDMGDSEKLGNQLTSAALEAVRHKFSPEFINRLDKIVVFKPLDRSELQKVLDIELRAVQERILKTTVSGQFVFNITEAGREFLLREGTNINYGARHLKRAIDRLVIHPISNLIATDQIVKGDAVRIDHRPGSPLLSFSLEGQGLPLPEMIKLASYPVALAETSITAGVAQAQPAQA
jgi:ATP-dependent Clp protease ATP-binding subunit ClpB